MTDDERFGSARGPGGKPGEYDWGEKPDLTVMSEEELRTRLKKLSKEERAISCRRDVIQGRSDPTRADLVLHGDDALPPEGLARVLLGEERYGGGVS